MARSSYELISHEAQPAERHLLTVAVKVRYKGAGGLKLAQLTSIRRVADREDRLQPARAAGDGAAVHPDIEAGAAAVGTVAALTNTAEGQSGDVQGSVVA